MGRGRGDRTGRSNQGQVYIDPRQAFQGETHSKDNIFLAGRGDPIQFEYSGDFDHKDYNSLRRRLQQDFQDEGIMNGLGMKSPLSENGNYRRVGEKYLRRAEFLKFVVDTLAPDTEEGKKKLGNDLLQYAFRASIYRKEAGIVDTDLLKKDFRTIDFLYDYASQDIQLLQAWETFTSSQKPTPSPEQSKEMIRAIHNRCVVIENFYFDKPHPLFSNDWE